MLSLCFHLHTHKEKEIFGGSPYLLVFPDAPQTGAVELIIRDFAFVKYLLMPQVQLFVFLNRSEGVGFCVHEL